MTHAQARVHAPWKVARSRVIWALRDSGSSKLENRAERIDGCCAYPQLAKKPDGSPHLVMQPCRDRMCPRCASGRSAGCKWKVADIVKGFDSCRFFTLTLQHRAAPLDAELKRLAKAFKDLRKEPAWKSLVKGGVYGIEATHNVESRRWHAHLHVLCDGEFFPHALLKKLWKKITGGSEIVYIEAVNNRGDAARYVSKYVCKPEAATDWPLERIAEFAEAMHGKRLLHTFGNAHGKKVEANEEEESPSGLEPVGSLHSVVKRAKTGHEPARRACEILQRMGHRFSDAAGLDRLEPTLTLPPVEAWEVEHVYSAVREAVEHFTAPPLEFPPVGEVTQDEVISPPPLLSDEWLEPPTPQTYR